MGVRALLPIDGYALVLPLLTFVLHRSGKPSCFLHSFGCRRGIMFYLCFFHCVLLCYFSIVEIRIGILVVNVIVVAVHGRLLLVSPVHASIRILLLLLLPVVWTPRPRGRLAVIGGGTPHNGLADAADPIVLFLFRVGIQQICGIRRRDLEGVALAGFQVGRFDGRAQRQIDHPVGRRILVGAIKELAALEQKEPAAPVLFLF
jgi:hypothetical protein